MVLALLFQALPSPTHCSPAAPPQPCAPMPASFLSPFLASPDPTLSCHSCPSTRRQRQPPPPKTFMASRRSFKAAWLSGVCRYKLSFDATSAAASRTKSLTASRCPFSTPRLSGVSPHSSFDSTSAAPSSTKIFTVSRCRFSAAHLGSVCPLSL